MATSSAAESELDDNRLSARERHVFVSLEHLFLEEGFRGLRIGDIAARLHCSRRTLYALAPSKEALFLLVTEKVLGAIDRDGRSGVAAVTEAGGSMREKLTALLEPGIAVLAEASPTFFAEIQAYPPAAKRLLEHQTSRIQQARELLDEGVASGEIRAVNTAVAAEVMLAGYRRIVEPSFLRTVDVSLEQAMRACEDLVFNGLFPPESGSE